MRQNSIDASKLEMKETIVNIRRVAKTVKGGRNMRFSVTMVVGDGAGHVGIGLGKAAEIPEAVRKATEDAKKKMVEVPIVGTTIPHKETGIFGAGKVLVMPAAQGCKSKVNWFKQLSKHGFSYYRSSLKPQDCRTGCETQRQD